jgi:hypothetical protein
VGCVRAVGTSRPKSSAEAREKGREYRLTCLPCPVRFRAGPRRQVGREARHVGPWANGRRWGVPTYVLAAPLAPGGVSARLGAKGRGVVAVPARDSARLRRRPACVGRCNMQAGRIGRNEPARVLHACAGSKNGGQS